MTISLKFIRDLQNPSGVSARLSTLFTSIQDTVVEDLLSLIMAIPAYLSKPFILNHIYAINMDNIDNITLTEGIHIPGKIMISTDPSLTFNLDPVTTNNMVTKIKIMDRKITTEPENLSFEVQACNNALDASPTWEDMTSEYINNEFYTFTNIIKTNANWAFSIKMVITKTQPTSEIELTDLYIAHI